MPPLLSPHTPHPAQGRQAKGAPPSPNYFALKVDPSSTTVNSTGSGAAQTPWSPANPQVLNAAATSPQTIVANNPDYEAFLKNTEDNRANLKKNSSLPQLNDTPASSSIPPPSSVKSANRKASASSATTPSLPSAVPIPKIDSADEVVHASRSPKRMLSSDTGSVLSEPRRQSPADFNDHASSRSLGSPPRRQDERAMRMSLPPKSSPSANVEPSHQRANTIASPTDADGPTLITPHYALELQATNGDKALVLDLRVSTQYAQARLTGALNLCIPTTLLKRPSYNVSRLADTFKDEGQKNKFSSWKSCAVLIVYDNNSTQLQEAQNCVNILKKFSSEGWKGRSFIIRGGFTEAARQCPGQIDETGPGNLRPASANLTIRSDTTDLPPVMGGCPMPAARNAANPFFSNIRQNMDLIDGVGQLPIQCPASLSKRDLDHLPQWLRRAANEQDKGKVVSDKFLRIEKREQRRMQQALSGDASDCVSPSTGHVGKVEIAGIEKGTKNRYNNIFPYEHSRVRLKGVGGDDCDYVNANFVQTSMSHKKYIATQGPIPATFNDFWNMVWQRDVRVVIMLTAEAEGGQLKAHNYWKEKRYGPVKLNFHSESRASLDGTRLKHPMDKRHAQRRSSHMDLASSNDGQILPNLPEAGRDDLPAVIVRRFTMSHDNYPFERLRELTHLQFASWPDFGAPASPLHVLKLVEQCDGVVRSTSSGPSDGPEPPTNRPVLVHCSAGCGRTGTFCTVDTVIDVLKRQRRHRHKPRQPTPMDIDTNQPAEAKSDALKPPSLIPKPQDVDGEWLNKDNIDLIENVVDEFRLQRLSMVQSLRQFVLCYETVLEWIAQLSIPRTA